MSSTRAGAAAQSSEKTQIYIAATVFMLAMKHYCARQKFRNKGNFAFFPTTLPRVGTQSRTTKMYIMSTS